MMIEAKINEVSGGFFLFVCLDKEHIQGHSLPLQMVIRNLQTVSSAKHLKYMKQVFPHNIHHTWGF